MNIFFWGNLQKHVCPTNCAADKVYLAKAIRVKSTQMKIVKRGYCKYPYNELIGASTRTGQLHVNDRINNPVLHQTIKRVFISPRCVLSSHQIYY